MLLDFKIRSDYGKVWEITFKIDNSEDVTKILSVSIRNASGKVSIYSKKDKTLKPRSEQRIIDMLNSRPYELEDCIRWAKRKSL